MKEIRPQAGAAGQSGGSVSESVLVYADQHVFYEVVEGMLVKAFVEWGIEPADEVLETDNFKVIVNSRKGVTDYLIKDRLLARIEPAPEEAPIFIPGHEGGEYRNDLE